MSSNALSVASYKNIFDPERVAREVERLPQSASEALRELLERMIENGPKRFCVKPAQASDWSSLYDELPNFSPALDELRSQIALAASAQDDLEIQPILLLGDPGIGKTHFAKRIAGELATGFNFIPMSQMTAGWILSGASSQWKSSKPGKVFEALVKGVYANPVILVDEVDKASGDSQHDPLGALYTLLERETAREFTDEFAEVPIDASLVVWVCTANDERSIPSPLLSRMRVFEIKPPDARQSAGIAKRMYADYRASKKWAERFDPELSDSCLDRLSGMAPRAMHQALRGGFGKACMAGRSRIEPGDLDASNPERQSIGFLRAS